MEHCERLGDLLNEERKVIERHLDKHKWYQGIEDRERAVTDFIKRYGWLMREVFCDKCDENATCVPYHEYLEQAALR